MSIQLRDFDHRMQELNTLSTVDAEMEFLKCCGSQRWVQAMAGARPFKSVDDLLTKANQLWWSVSAEDWLEAFHAHPKIGEQKGAATQTEQARTWSAQEQSGVAAAADEVKTALAQGNLEYEQRFGFIYIVCATGKSSAEMLAILKERLTNDPETELRAAAEEQSKITRLRLEKLLNN
jgi:OHCU decarboxylase